MVGGIYNVNKCSTGCGGILEFDYYTNLTTRKYDFNSETVGFGSSNLQSEGNNKLYGTLVSEQAVSTAPNASCSIYQYDFVTNTFSVLKSYGLSGNVPRVLLPYDGILKASNNSYYFIKELDLVKFNPANNQSRLITQVRLNSQNQVVTTFMPGFIEICRKPSYQEFLPNTYTPEAGTAFTYNIQNTNASTYVWKKGTTVLPAQITGILNLPSLTASDTGIYTCTMTNECGETVTMPLNINVTNLATETIDNYKEFSTLHPNPTKGIINLKFPENRGLKAISYKITNLLGQVVLENDIAKNNTATSITIDTAGFANGIYQVTLATDKGNWNGKFVKE